MWILPPFQAVWPVILSSTPIILGSLLFPQWLFQGLERMGFIAASVMFARALTIPLIFLCVNNSHDTWIAALIQSCSTVFSGFLACGLIWRQQLISWMRPKWEDVLHVLIDGWHIFISTAAISLYTTINPVLIGMMTNNTIVGLFSAADKIRMACQSVISPLSVAVYPRVGALMATNRQTGLLLVRKLLLIQGGVTLFISFALWLLAPWIVVVVMGHQFDAAVSVLRVMAPLPFLIGLSNVFGIQTMLPLGLKKSFSRIVLFSGIINISLILVLAPVWGAEGAAAAILFTESFVTFAMVLVLRRSQIHVLTSNQTTPT
jgi:O-antigen/teichoic acid export membrane protein